jgi:chromosome partitioning protein
MIVISIINLKGGVGKTFTSYNMAYELGKRGYKVLVLDNDKQGNISKAFSKYNASKTCKVAKLLNSMWKLPTEIIEKTGYENIDIISSNMTLFTATYQLTFEEKGEQFSRYKSFLNLVRESYDYCIIDNPPDISLNVVNALAATDEVIVTVKIDEWALEGLDIVSDQIEEAKKINPRITLLGALVTMYRNNDANIVGVEWLQKKSKVNVLGKIRYTDKAVESTFFNKPLYEFSPLSAAAQDYKKFVTSYLESRREK